MIRGMKTKKELRKVRIAKIVSEDVVVLKSGGILINKSKCVGNVVK